MAGGARRHALHAFLQQLRRGAAEALLRSFPQGRGHRLGQAAARCRSTSAIRARSSCCAPRTNGRSRARSGRSSISQPADAGARHRARRRRETTLELRDDRRRRHLPDAAADAGARDHRAGRGQAARSRPTPPTPTCSWSCGCSIRTARRSPSSAPTIRARRSASAGCAPRTASSIRSSRCRTGPSTRTTRSGRSTPGEPVELDIEIWPTCIVVPPGYRLGADGARQGLRSRRHATSRCPTRMYPMKGVGPFLHIDPDDRPPEIFGGTQHAALRRRQAALPVVAGHSRRRKLRKRVQLSGGS